MNFDEEWFINLWESNADEYEFFELAKSVRPGLTFDEFDHGWQYTVILHPVYEYAKEEFMIAVNQTF